VFRCSTTGNRGISSEPTWHDITDDRHAQGKFGFSISDALRAADGARRTTPTPAEDTIPICPGISHERLRTEYEGGADGVERRQTRVRIPGGGMLSCYAYECKSTHREEDGKCVPRPTNDGNNTGRDTSNQTGQFTVTYNLNGGQWTAGFTAPTGGNADTRFNLPNANRLGPPAANQVLVGWRYVGAGGRDFNEGTVIDDGWFTLRENVTVTAVWRDGTGTIDQVVVTEEPLVAIDHGFIPGICIYAGEGIGHVRLTQENLQRFNSMPGAVPAADTDCPAARAVSAAAPSARQADLDNIDGLRRKLEDLGKPQGWRTAEGNFNWLRLGLNVGVGAAAGTAAGVLTNQAIRTRQLKSGYENIQCSFSMGGTAVFGETFIVR
jgi:hypothetical protein